MTITIHQKRVRCTNELGAAASWDALNVRGQGKAIATVSGDFSIDPDYAAGGDTAVIDGQHWVLRDVLALAQRGERGLSLVEA